MEILLACPSVIKGERGRYGRRGNIYMCGSPWKGEGALMVLHLDICLYGDFGFSGVRMKW